MVNNMDVLETLKRGNNNELERLAHQIAGHQRTDEELKSLAREFSAMYDRLTAILILRKDYRRKKMDALIPKALHRKVHYTCEELGASTACGRQWTRLQSSNYARLVTESENKITCVQCIRRLGKRERHIIQGERK